MTSQILKNIKIDKALTLGLLAAAVLSCSPKERESLLPAEERSKVFAIEDLKDISQEKSAAYHIQSSELEAAKKDLVSKEKADGAVTQGIVLTEKLKTLATTTSDKALASGLEKATFAFAIVNDAELHIYKVESAANIKNLDLDKSISVRQIRLMRAIHLNKDMKKNDDLTRELQNLRFSEGAAGQNNQAARLVRVNRYAIKTFGTLTNKTTDFGEKKTVLTVKETAIEAATHILLGDAIPDAKPEEKPAEGAAADPAKAATNR